MTQAALNIWTDFQWSAQEVGLPSPLFSALQLKGRPPHKLQTASRFIPCSGSYTSGSYIASTSSAFFQHYCPLVSTLLPSSVSAPSLSSSHCFQGKTKLLSLICNVLHNLTMNVSQYTFPLFFLTVPPARLFVPASISLNSNTELPPFSP